MYYSGYLTHLFSRDKQTREIKIDSLLTIASRYNKTSGQT
ncbi:hypothetical protein HBHAL_4308 [Halobacillus halophilus DSM 2266]|uniref:Uncharacterized protein n=1 Tax=Halobacillus halophilus (strain ATCC 35676 / DSM 2266 / JCM 20832 / KCTC 3685 / LMG 17431 / NBRC 102448 / NCIMB 2269) TaxID=866895 RepID=I0JR79_HALH3|nr:hypothetical protein HBHAL_4308 [Halobacillus halophilus DSM 2266]